MFSEGFIDLAVSVEQLKIKLRDAVLGVSIGLICQKRNLSGRRNGSGDGLAGIGRNGHSAAAEGWIKLPAGTAQSKDRCKLVRAVVILSGNNDPVVRLNFDVMNHKQRRVKDVSLNVDLPVKRKGTVNRPARMKPPDGFSICHNDAT